MTKAWVLLAALLCLPGCIPASQEEFVGTGQSQLLTFDSAGGLERFFALMVEGPSDPVGRLVGSGAAAPFAYDPGYALPYDGATEGFGGFAGSSAAWDAGLPAQVRTDGQCIYTLSDYDMTILKAVPAEQMAIVGRYDLSSSLAGHSLYLRDGQVVLLSQVGSAWWDPAYTTVGDTWLPDEASFFEVSILDVTDPRKPVLQRQYTIQGEPLLSRLVDGRLVLAVANYPGGTYYEPLTSADGMTAETILPKYRFLDGDGNEVIEPLLTCDAVRRPASPDGSGLLTIATIDLDDPAARPVATGLMGFAGCVYATPDTLYVTNSDYRPDGTYRDSLDIHKYNLAGPVASYQASGQVPGRPIGAGLSEKDGLLRVVTAGVDGLHPQLVVLEQAGGRLEVVGQLDTLTADSEPWNVVFAGDYLLTYDYDVTITPYLVTLADPRNPRPIGKLAITTAVEYVHMLDATHLLVIGYDSTPDGRYSTAYWDMAMWMYDMTDPAQPVEIHREIVGSGGTMSSSLDYHNQMTLSGGLLALQVDLYEGDIPEGWGQWTFGGQYVYRISPDKGFEKLGRVETATAYYTIGWERGLFLGDAFYAVTNGAAKASLLDDVDEVVAEVPVPGI